jgi:hypothetical protein
MISESTIHRRNRAPIASRLPLSQNRRKQASTWPHHLAVPSGAFKTIPEPLVCLVQIVHLSCTNTNTIFKRTGTRFDMTHIPQEFDRVRLKWFLSLWYVWPKPCTYIASRLALSLNRLKRASTWALSPRSTIGCIQNGSWAYGMFGANHASILQQH